MGSKCKYDNKDLIRDEFITSDIPYRALAEKYKIPRSTIERWMRVEKWQKKREIFRAKAEKTVDKTLDKIDKSKSKASEGRFENAKNRQETRTDKLYKATEKLIDKAVSLLELELSPRDLKAVSGTLADCKMIFNIKSPLDIKEQETRIKQLEKSLEDKVVESSGCEVTFIPLEGVDVESISQ